MEINENHIKWNKDQFPIKSSLEHDDVTLTLRGAIVKVAYHDNFDGTFDRIHTFKPKFVEAVQRNGPAVKSEDKRKQSQLLKGQIEHLRREFKPTEDDQEFYDKAMTAIRHECVNISKTHNLI